MSEEKIHKDDSSNGSEHAHEKETIPPAADKTRHDVFDVGVDSHQLNAIFENPLAGVDPDQLMKDVDNFCSKYGLMESVDVIKRGALVARDPRRGTEVEGITVEEQEALVNEKARKWHHPWML